MTPYRTPASLILAIIIWINIGLGRSTDRWFKTGNWRRDRMQCIFHFSAASITDIDLVLTITVLFSASRSWTRSLRLLMIVSGLPFCKDKKCHLKFVFTWRTIGPWGYKTDWSATEIIQLLLRLYVDINNILVDFNASQQSFKQEMFVIFD